MPRPHSHMNTVSCPDPTLTWTQSRAQTALSHGNEVLVTIWVLCWTCQVSSKWYWASGPFFMWENGVYSLTAPPGVQWGLDYFTPSPHPQIYSVPCGSENGVNGQDYFKYSSCYPLTTPPGVLWESTQSWAHSGAIGCNSGWGPDITEVRTAGPSSLVLPTCTLHMIKRQWSNTGWWESDGNKVGWHTSLSAGYFQPCSQAFTQCSRLQEMKNLAGLGTKLVWSHTGVCKDCVDKVV